MLIYILENKEIDYVTYKQTYGIQRTDEINKKYTSTDLERFEYHLKTVNNIFIELEFNCQRYIENNGKNTIYHYRFKNKRILFNVYNLTLEQYKKYDLIIFYLILLKKQFINFQLLNNITKEVIHYRKLARLKIQLQEVILEELIKNSITKSYQLKDDEL
ncbi:MAG: hypothetical protein R3Y64_11555 [Peptostreptococcaceae bacterium]